MLSRYFTTALNMADDGDVNDRGDQGESQKPEKMFTLKKWNAVAMWSWDVECDTCAICRVQVMGKYYSVFLSYLNITNLFCYTGCQI